jgi:hypothetical protein
MPLAAVAFIKLRRLMCMVISFDACRVSGRVVRGCTAYAVEIPRLQAGADNVRLCAAVPR